MKASFLMEDGSRPERAKTALLWREYNVSDGETISLTLPCFDGTPFDAVQRMNRFYEEAAEQLYAYAQSLIESRSDRFQCRTDVIETDGVWEVTLRIRFRQPGCAAVKKTLTHRWEDGVLMQPEKRKR